MEKLLFLNPESEVKLNDYKYEMIFTAKINRKCSRYKTDHTKFI